MYGQGGAKAPPCFHFWRKVRLLTGYSSRRGMAPGTGGRASSCHGYKEDWGICSPVQAGCWWRRQSRRTRMSLPASLGKGRLSVFFHGRRNTQDGTAQGARQQSRRRPRSPVGTSGPACDYGGHGLPFVVLSRICRQPLSSPAIMHPGRMERGCMVPHGEASRRKFCFLSDH